MTLNQAAGRDPRDLLEHDPERLQPKEVVLGDEIKQAVPQAPLDSQGSTGVLSPTSPCRSSQHCIPLVPPKAGSAHSSTARLLQRTTQEETQ
ncbi:MAG TPA: hypothetical protein ACN46Q_04330 [Prochlorococcus sp.]